MKITFKHIYIYICLTIIMGTSLIYGFWALWPDKVIEFKGPVVVNKKEYKPGDQIIYTISYCKYKNLPGTVYRSLVNSTRTSYTEITNNMAVGCRTTKVADLTVPDYNDDGVYHLEATVVYKVNPLRDEIVSWKSEEFIIKK